MEDTFVKHFMYALDRLQTTWMGETGLNSEKFNLQLLYLIRLLPDKKKQAEVMKTWSDLLSAPKIPGVTESELKAYAGMEIVTELILFICDSFELINTDIIGPATSKQYQDAIIQLPEMTKPVEEPDISTLEGI